MKALYLSRSSEGWGHQVGLLIQELSTVGREAPKDFFTEEQARDAVRRANNIIAWCASLCRA